MQNQMPTSHNARKSPAVQSQTLDQPIQVNKRFDFLDILKFICTFLVVSLHAPFFGDSNKYLAALSRVAVPLFFITSGFFFEKSYPNVYPLKNITRLLKMIIISSFLYCVWGVWYYCIYTQDRILEDVLFYYYQYKPYLSRLGNYLIYHTDPVYGGYHLWYLNAFLYTWILVYAIRRIFSQKGIAFLNCVTPLLLVYAVLRSNYHFLFFESFSEVDARNFLFCGVPYFCIGSWIYRCHDRLCTRLSFRSLLLLGITFCVTVCTEEYFLSQIRTSRAGDYYLSTCLQTIVTFLLFLKLHTSVSFPRILKPMASIGKNYTTLIYLLHPFVIVVLQHFFLFISYHYIHYEINIDPILVFTVSLLLSMMIRRISSRLSLLLRSKKQTT